MHKFLDFFFVYFFVYSCTSISVTHLVLAGYLVDSQSEKTTEEKMLNMFGSYFAPRLIICQYNFQSAFAWKWFTSCLTQPILFLQHIPVPNIICTPIPIGVGRWGEILRRKPPAYFNNPCQVLVYEKCASNTIRVRRCGTAMWHPVVGPNKSYHSRGYQLKCKLAILQ